MLTPLRDRTRSTTLLTASVALAVLALAFLLGLRASATWLGLLIASFGALLLLSQPRLGLLALVAAALLIPLEIGTGTEVKFNAVTLLIPAILALGVLDMVRRRHVTFVRTRANLPLALFLLAGLFSLLIGRVTWDPFVPTKSNFLLVQLTQWGIFALSAGAFWLTANLVADLRWLRRMTWTFLLIGGSVAILRALPGASAITDRFATAAFVRAPFWALLFGLAGGQLLFNRRLTVGPRLFLLATLAAALVYALVQQQDAASNWVGIAAALGVLLWLRFPRLRWLILLAVVVLALLGVLLPAVYNFAGGDQEWRESGGSRVELAKRVIEVTKHNPITGLGPAAYRPYAAMTPLRYRGANWIVPMVNSHNNYIDLFSQVGIVGLTLFLWFAAEIARLGRRLHHRYTTGFAAGYVNGMLAVGVTALVLMIFADWILPFIYNIGFPGFQASVLVWLFLGGLVALESMPQPVSSER